MKSLEELHRIREEKRKELELRVNTKADTREKHILVCQGTGCTSSKSPEIIEEYKKGLMQNIKPLKVVLFLFHSFHVRAITSINSDFVTNVYEKRNIQNISCFNFCWFCC